VITTVGLVLAAVLLVAGAATTTPALAIIGAVVAAVAYVARTFTQRLEGAPDGERKVSALSAGTKRLNVSRSMYELLGIALIVVTIWLSTR
jgi:hypothetical protein